MKKTVVQEHHISYSPEVTVIVYKGEHMILTQLQWRKKFSKGFFEALEQFINEHKKDAVELHLTRIRA
jgi:hypothetical protein